MKYIIFLLALAACSSTKNVSKTSASGDSTSVKKQDSSIMAKNVVTLTTQSDIDTSETTIIELQPAYTGTDTSYAVKNTVTPAGDYFVEIKGNKIISNQKIKSVTQKKTNKRDTASTIKQTDSVIKTGSVYDSTQKKTTATSYNKTVKRSYAYLWWLLLIPVAIVFYYRNQLKQLI